MSGALVEGRPRTARAGPPGRALDVALVGFQDQGNLGMGYLAAQLAAHGYAVELVDFRDGPERIVPRLAAAQPAVVGFSLIFQYYLPGFRELARALRAAGVRSHLTIGGHYPSLCHEELLEAMPELDSVVRFEGELTLLDLVSRLTAGAPWQDVPGIAFVHDGEIVETEQRALVRDLDELPLPYRPLPPEQVLGIDALPVLASRGCARRCSFCSIHTFYRTAPGKVVRVRAPDRVAAEMRLLNEERGVRIFLFQDDDFPLWGKAGKRWVRELVDELDRQGLVGRVIWKISCRAEYVEPELFGLLRDAGLYLVYMGLESGTTEGLEILNKQLTVEENRAAVDVLRSLGLMFEYGFMLFDPSSTFASVRRNVGFLRELVGDGSAAATFCRMLPYGGTPIRDWLEARGRLRGDVTRPDYDFLDLRLNDYHRWLDRAAARWIHGDGVSHQLNWAWHELEVAERLVGGLTGADAYRVQLRDLTSRSNEALFALVEESSQAFEAGEPPAVDDAGAAFACRSVARELLSLRNAFVASNAGAILGASEAERVTAPIVSPQIF